MLRMAIALLALGAAGVAVAQDQYVSFTATVIGADGRPRPSVTVQALGPSTVLAATDSSGKVSFQLLAGTYEFRVSRDFKRSQFSQEVNASSTSATFTIAW